MASLHQSKKKKRLVVQYELLVSVRKFKYEGTGTFPLNVVLSLHSIAQCSFTSCTNGAS